jgi:hypothetical protein
MMPDMSPSTVERNLSDFLRRSGDVLREVEDHDVLLRRRDGADLMLVQADRETVIRDTVGLSSGFMSWFARMHGPELVAGLPDVVPWLRFLPEGDREAFAQELVQTLEACISLQSYDQLGVLLSQWRKTAYLWSRPELLAELRTDHAPESYDEPVAAPGP